MSSLMSLSAARRCWRAVGQSQISVPLTRLAPSTHIPGTTGVFATTHIKKHTPLEIVPACLTPPATAAVDASALPSASDATIHAPPYMCNMVEAPRHTISLRRFLALRAQFGDSTGAFFHAATARGWYLLLPASAVPLADEAGLRAWQSRHHHRYLNLGKKKTLQSASRQRQVTGSERDGKEGLPRSLQAIRRAKAGALAQEERRWSVARMGAAADGNGDRDEEELTEEELRAVRREILVEERRRQKEDAADGLVETDSRSDVEMEDEEDVEDGVVGAIAADEKADLVALSKNKSMPFSTEASTSPSDEGHSLSASAPTPETLKQAPYTIPESHFFAINDGVLWPLPPKEDLADPLYWKDHRQRMSVYESSAGLSAEDRTQFLHEAMQRSAALSATLTDNEKAGTETDKGEEGNEESKGDAVPETEAYTQGERVFNALTRKANVAIEVDDTTKLVTLKPLVDLQAGEELLLHYGREWWTEKLLSSLFLNASDEEMKSIRWIEALFSAPTDIFEPFPLLSVAHKVKRTTKRMSGKARKKASRASTAGAGERQLNASDACLVVYNTVNKKEATDAEVLVAAVRLSCKSVDFLALLLADRDGVFDQADADGEVPMGRLREAMLFALRGYPDDGGYADRPVYV